MLKNIKKNIEKKEYDKLEKYVDKMIKEIPTQSKEVVYIDKLVNNLK